MKSISVYWQIRFKWWQYDDDDDDDQQFVMSTISMISSIWKWHPSPILNSISIDVDDDVDVDVDVDNNKE